VPLQGAELEEFLAKERAVKEKEAAMKAAEDRRQRILEADADDTDEDEDTDSDSDDDDDENEVEETLISADGMDSTETHKPSKEGKRKTGKRRNMNDAAWSGTVDDDGVSKQMLSYDIYLKGNVSKATSFFKSADGQAQRFRMFPYVEKKRRIDDYGELVDVEVWMRRGKALEEHAEDDDGKELKRIQEEEEEKVCLAVLCIVLSLMDSQKSPREPPFKFITTEVEVQLACRLFFVDLEGLNDGRAVKTIVPQVNPRKMVCWSIQLCEWYLSSHFGNRSLYMRPRLPLSI
jgi:cleavage and polyadenylation specificity factor subunit 2